MLFFVAIILLAVTTVALFVLDFKKMTWTSRSFLLIQFCAIILLVFAFLGISF